MRAASKRMEHDVVAALRRDQRVSSKIGAKTPLEVSRLRSLESSCPRLCNSNKQLLVKQTGIYALPLKCSQTTASFFFFLTLKFVVVQCFFAAGEFILELQTLVTPSLSVKNSQDIRKYYVCAHRKGQNYSCSPHSSCPSCAANTMRISITLQW